MRSRKCTVKALHKDCEESATERARIFKELCTHVAAGYSVESFPELSNFTVKSYLERFPGEFDVDELDKALRKGRVVWEGIGKAQAEGQCLGNSRSWFLNMVNRYGWRDKIEVEAQHSGAIEVQVVSYASKRASQDSVSGSTT